VNYCWNKTSKKYAAVAITTSGVCDKAVTVFDRMLWNNWHLPSSCQYLTIVTAYLLDYRNQQLLLCSVFRTLLHVWCWICVLVIASQMVYVNCIGFRLSQGFSSSFVWWCIWSTLAAVRLTSVHQFNSLLTMLIVQVFVLLQLHGTFYQDCVLSSVSISFNWSYVSFKKAQNISI